jgi:hypothetical protein
VEKLSPPKLYRHIRIRTTAVVTPTVANSLAFRTVNKIPQRSWRIRLRTTFTTNWYKRWDRRLQHEARTQTRRFSDNPNKELDRAGTLLNAPNHHPKHPRLNGSNSPPHAPSTYPALCFWLPTPDQLPGSELDSRPPRATYPALSLWLPIPG